MLQNNRINSKENIIFNYFVKKIADKMAIVSINPNRIEETDVITRLMGHSPLMIRQRVCVKYSRRLYDNQDYT